MTPSVTEVLKDMGISTIYQSEAVQAGATRGRLVHAAGHLMASGKALDPLWLSRHLHDCRPYVDALDRFFNVHRVSVDYETEIICKLERYVGHIDWLGVLDNIPALIDIKTGEAPQLWWPLQTAAYLYALRAEKYPNADKMIRVVLQLTRGGYKLHFHTDPREMSEFITLVRAWHVTRKYQGGM